MPPLLNSIRVPARSAFIFFLSILLYAEPVFSQFSKYYPKEENGKWGIAEETMSYKKKNPEKIERWVFKPQWNRVWIDSTRYGCLSGAYCDAFITYKNNKYGYAWSDGTVLDNEFEKIDISHYVGKKNGHWGGLVEQNQVLPFEYDSLKYHTFARDYEIAHTIYLGYTGLKNGSWSIMLAKLVDKSPAGIEVIVTGNIANCYSYENGVIINKDGQWYFVNLKKYGTPIYSNSYDSIKTIGNSIKTIGNLYAVKKQGKWYFTVISNPNMLGGKGWEGIDETSEPDYYAVWENGMVGVVALENNFLKEVIKPRGSAVKLVRNSHDDLVIEMKEGSQKIVYDKNAKVLNTSGDATVVSSKTLGPFRIEQHDNYKDVTVYDAASNIVLIPRSQVSVSYKSDPVMGEVLFINENKYGNDWHGLYHYKTSTYIKPTYLYGFEPLGAGYLIAGKREAEMDLWDKKTMTKIKTPFIIRSFKNEYQQLLKDDKGQWHEPTGEFAFVPASKVINFRKMFLGGIEVEAYEDYSKILLSLNGKPVNLPIQREDWMIQGKVYALTIQSKRTEYFECNGQALACNYILPADIEKIATSVSIKPWPGDKCPGPVMLIDSAKKLVVVNMINNQRIALPMVVSGNGIVHEGVDFSICNFSSYDAINFCGKVKSRCRDCSNGYITKDVKKTIQGQTTYTTTKTTSSKSGYETKWDPKTNSYKGVKTSTPVTNYDTKANKEPDRVVEKTVKVKCDVCKGTGTVMADRWLYWNGKVLKEPSF
jgi:hypothetical protein